MERRDFLKGVIGVVAGTQVPWVAQSPVYKTPTLTGQTAHRVRALHLKQSKLKLFKAVCITESGQELYAPKVSQIKVQNTNFGHCVLVTWSFVEIELKQTVNVNRVRLIDDLGAMIMERDLVDPVIGCPGDTIRLVDVTIRID